MPVTSAWDQARLLLMIQEKERESAALEYKGAAALAKEDRPKNEISKDVSAFANAGGGVIIYGIAENSSREADKLEGIDPKMISKEWLEDVISSRIHRKIHLLTICRGVSSRAAISSLFRPSAA